MKLCAAIAAALYLHGAATVRAAPLDLTACVRLALAQNPDVQDAVDATLSALIGRDVPLADYHVKAVPSVSGGLQGGNNTNQRYDLDLTRKLFWTGTQIGVSGGTSVYSSVPQTSVPYLSQTRVTLTQPLWQGRTRLENSERVDDADRRIGAAKHTLAGTREELILQVTRGFYDVVRAEELVRVADGSLARVADLDKEARAKLSMGAVSKMDVFRTELQSARLKNALVEQQARRETALDQLRGLLGLGDVALEVDAGASTDGIAARSELALAPGAGVEQTIEEAMARRPEVAEAEEEVRDAERKALLARYKIWPAIDLVGSYARQGIGNDLEASTHLKRTEWLVGLSSTTPLDRTEERVAASQADIQLRGRERRYRAVREQTARQVRDAWRELERTRAARTLAAEIVEQAQNQAELARFRYEKGVTDNFDLVQAESQLAEAQSGRALAAIEEIVAAAQLRRAAGTLGDAFGISSQPPDERLR